MKKIIIRRLFIKYTVIVVLVVLLFFLLIWSLRGSRYPGLNVHATMVVNGTEIHDSGIRIYQRGSRYLASIPFVALLEELGCTVDKTDLETIIITVHGERYSLSGSSLCKLGEDKNYIIPEPGRESTGAAIEGTQLFLPDGSVLATLDNLGIDVKLTIDVENRLVIIKSAI